MFFTDVKVTGNGRIHSFLFGFSRIQVGLKLYLSSSLTLCFQINEEMILFILT